MKMWKIIVLTGVFLIIFGLIIMLFEQFHFHLPGDIYIKRGNFEFYFPIVSCIVISLILTLVLNLIFRK